MEILPSQPILSVFNCSGIFNAFIAFRPDYFTLICLFILLVFTFYLNSNYLTLGRDLIPKYFLIVSFSFISIIFQTLKSFFYFLFSKNDPKLFSFGISFFFISISILTFLSVLLLSNNLFKVRITLSIFGIYFYSFLCAFIPFHLLIFLSVLIIYNIALYINSIYIAVRLFNNKDFKLEDLIEMNIHPDVFMLLPATDLVGLLETKLNELLFNK